MKSKTKQILNKLLPSFLFKVLNNSSKNKLNISKNVDYEKTEFKEELKNYLGKIETKSTNQDYQMIMRYLYSQDKIVHKAQDVEGGGDVNEKNKARDATEKQVMENLDKENEKYKSNFFNLHSIQILENTDNQHLVNIACKSYVGDTDIPHDPERAFLILKLAKALCKNEPEIKETQFFLDYFRKNSATDAKEVNEACGNIFKDTGYIKAKYVTSRDLFKIITYNFMGVMQEEIPKEEKEYLYAKIYHTMEEALEHGIYEAYYFLGLMNLNGYYTKVNVKKAFYYFCIAASYSHALAYYELYKMIKNDTVSIYTRSEVKEGAMFDYLKTSAEEGFVEAMYELGNCYLNGNLCKRNKLKALAWHRQACRNGYILSYEPCGDLLYTGGDGVKPNKSLSLVMYYCAYVKGITEMKEKVLRVSDELKLEGEPIPEMILI